MHPIKKLTAFALVLTASFGGGVALGAVAGPDADDEPAPAHSPFDHEDQHP